MVTKQGNEGSAPIEEDESMKKAGKLLTMRGSIPMNTNGQRLQIFDGKYTTGYRIVEFYVAPENPSEAQSILMKAFTSKTTPSISKFDWGDSQEIAWATWGIDTGTGGANFFLIDEDNMVIEDLYLSFYSETGDSDYANYYIVLQKYEFPAWTGAGFLVENLGQGGPQ